MLTFVLYLQCIESMLSFNKEDFINSTIPLWFGLWVYSLHYSFLSCSQCSYSGPVMFLVTFYEPISLSTALSVCLSDSHLCDPPSPHLQLISFPQRASPKSPLTSPPPATSIQRAISPRWSHLDEMKWNEGVLLQIKNPTLLSKDFNSLKSQHSMSLDP